MFQNWTTKEVIARLVALTSEETTFPACVADFPLQKAEIRKGCYSMLLIKVGLPVFFCFPQGWVFLCGTPQLKELALPISILAGTPGTRSLPVVTLAAAGWLVDLLSGCKISWFSGNICKHGYKDGLFHCLVWLAEAIFWLRHRKSLQSSSV